ncbi:hypothetical protein IT417_00710 [bacterium]|nr:hypothetical protein [bacterium]
MKGFYPATTPLIMHKGNAENVYRLDCLDHCIRFMKRWKSNFEVVDIKYNGRSRSESIELVKTVHNANFISCFQSGTPKEFFDSMGIQWQPKLFDFVMEQSITSKEVVDEVMLYDRAVAITGGGHHSETDKPYGFGPINTMSISAIEALKRKLKVAVIDLDTHYSNGCMEILKGRDGVKFYSLWNQKLDKWSVTESGGNIWHRRVKDVDDYFVKLEELVTDVKCFQPDFVIYHLGLDVLETDRMGGVHGLDEKKLLEREMIVKDMVLGYLKSKIAVFLGGAYIDRSKGEPYAQQMKEITTKLYYQALTSYSDCNALN